MQPDREASPKGGWGWLIVPIVVMVIGGNLWFGGFYALTGNVQDAARRTLAIGPITWSLNQLVLLLIATRRLRARGVTLGEVLGQGGPTRSDLAWGLAGAVVASALILGLLQLQGNPMGAPGWPTWVLVYWTAVTSVTAGVGEEVYFRGFLFRRLDRLGSVVLLIVTSLAFAAWHVSPAMLLHTFVVGLLYGSLTMRSGRLWPAIVAHVGTDAIGGLGMLLGIW